MRLGHDPKGQWDTKLPAGPSLTVAELLQGVNECVGRAALE
jgi:hypothetical protein